MYLPTSKRVISFTSKKVNTGLNNEETNRCIYVFGKMQLFADEEFWSILTQRCLLEKKFLKFDPQTGTQKGLVFAANSSDKEVEQVLSWGQVIDLGNSHLWLEKGQKNSITILETALIRGGKTLFIEYVRRVDAELAKSGLSRRFEGQGNE
ncbi:MAG: hypothetical protein EZS28_025573 [Streblomastix strix]|uniref:Uncharacterized protein n=1 Tax=Streblomastix strix TaxID=222440 RepID=A0A5J4V8S6_9EUKA|nr:MAG: hypothetical protein EZS28_025573 [Streblomastix strix]